MATATARSGQHDNFASDVELAASGDRLAFERLYRQNVERVFSIVMRMIGDRQRAEEITQDVFVRAWEKLALFRGESLFSTWLHKLAVNVVLNILKSEKTERLRSAHDAPAAELIPRPPAMDGERMDLERAISLLPKGARTVFVLHDVEGFRHEEIASQLGITTGGSKSQLHRARMLLRQELDR